MSCENCNIRITNVIGTPSTYKIRWTKLNSNGDIVYVNNGPISAEDIRSTVNQDGSGGLEIFAGGPGHPELGQFWDGNNISIRFENFNNTECYLDVIYSCEPATTTQAQISDCCDGMVFTIETTGSDTEQLPLAGLTTRGFLAGSFQQTINPDGFTWVVDQPGFGKICYPEIVRDDGQIRTIGLEWVILLRNRFNQFVEADGLTVQSIPNAVGRVQMTRPWQSNTGVGNEAVYVCPNGTCFRGKLDEADQGLTIWDEIV